MGGWALRGRTIGDAVKSGAGLLRLLYSSFMIVSPYSISSSKKGFPSLLGSNYSAFGSVVGVGVGLGGLTTEPEEMGQVPLGLITQVS